MYSRPHAEQILVYVGYTVIAGFIVPDHALSTRRLSQSWFPVNINDINGTCSLVVIFRDYIPGIPSFFVKSLFMWRSGVVDKYTSTRSSNEFQRFAQSSGNRFSSNPSIHLEGQVPFTNVHRSTWPQQKYKKVRTVYGWPTGFNHVRIHT